MRSSFLIAALAGLVLAGACATSTPYQAAGDGARGYADQQIEDDRWRISFSGNSLTDRETVETYLLYRAAELTDQQGYDWFRVVERETDTDSRLVATGFSRPRFSPYYSGFYCNYNFYGPYARHGFYDPFGPGFGAPDYREITRYEASAEILLGRGEPPEDDPAFFTADEVLMNLAGQIVRPEA